MKKIITLMAIGLFIINTTGQETKPVTIKSTKKEYCCAAAVTNDKAITAADPEQCQIKCKAEAKIVKREEKKCNEKMDTAEGKKCCTKKA
jgi:hypothetical protein